ncbi:hypothetical protein FRC20_011479 [Serendipita sp. 405]|nr:hypothetical protein FRC20_011479 [Serendipita sp. 405]
MRRTIAVIAPKTIPGIVAGDSLFDIDKDEAEVGFDKDGIDAEFDKDDTGVEFDEDVISAEFDVVWLDDSLVD